MSKPKIVITGTGRSGTTLLVQILTDLGLDTGFSPDAPIDERTHAGLETRLDAPGAPRIVKSPNLSRRLAEIMEAGTVEIEHVIIPVRDLDVAAASRVRATRYGSNLHAPGGLFGTVRATRQREALAVLWYELMLTVVRYDLAFTLLDFPRLATDWRYTHEKLAFLDPEIPAERWREAIERRADPTLIHETPLSGAERRLTAAGTFYNRVIARPARGVRKLVAGRGTDPGARGPGN